MSGHTDDPTASAEWNDGCDFAMTQLCIFLGVDPAAVTWDAATETVDGDVRAVIGGILRAKFGEDWGPQAQPDNSHAELVKALEEAIPHLETLHSLLPVGEARRFVFTKIKNARAALAKATPSRNQVERSA